MRNYSHFAIVSAQFAGSPSTKVCANPGEVQVFLDASDPGTTSLESTEVWMPNSKEYFQYWINQSLSQLGYSFGQLQPPFFLLESPKNSGRFEYPGFPRITFKH
jgi:hypothetical protein